MNLRTRQMIIGLVMFFFFLFLSIMTSIALTHDIDFWIYKGLMLFAQLCGIYLIFQSLKKDE